MCGDEIFLLEEVRSATIFVYTKFCRYVCRKDYKCLIKGVENGINQIPKEDLKKLKFSVTYYNYDT